jgi:hypothetical protein
VLGAARPADALRGAGGTERSTCFIEICFGSNSEVAAFSGHRRFPPLKADSAGMLDELNDPA